MDLKLTENIRNTISLPYKQKKKKKKTGKIRIILELFFLAKKSILAYISLKVNIIYQVGRYAILTSYADRFS